MRRIGIHVDRQTRTAQAAFAELCGTAAEARREREINALPKAAWRGRTLRTIRCVGTTGRGPHVVNVPDAVLWSLLDLRCFRCPYHAGSPVDDGTRQQEMPRGI